MQDAHADAQLWRWLLARLNRSVLQLLVRHITLGCFSQDFLGHLGLRCLRRLDGVRSFRESGARSLSCLVIKFALHRASLDGFGDRPRVRLRWESLEAPI